MIALRGKLERVKKEPAEGSAPPSGPPITEEEAWVWKGHWAFGATLPEDEKKWQKFVYKWEKKVPPSEVVVISLSNAAAEAAAAEEEEEEEAKTDTPKATGSEIAAAPASAANVATTPETDKKKDPEGDAAKSKPKEGEDSKTNTQGDTKNEETVESTKEGEKSDKPEDSVKPSEGNVKTDAKPTPASKEAGEDQKGKTTEEPQSTVKEQTEVATKEIAGATESEKKNTASANESQKKEDTSAKTTEATTTGNPSSATTTETTTTTTKQRPKITFSTPLSPDDPPFTDASEKHPDKCPAGGMWKGHFENATKPIKRKNHTIHPIIQKIEETFHIYLNATPRKEAQTWFATDEIATPQKRKKTEATLTEGAGVLKEGLIHVRGTGINQFGTFELLGSFDVETGALECQRMYVSATIATPVRRRSSRGGDTKAGSSYNTRKRQMSWKRRSSFGVGGSDSDGEGATGVARRRSGSAGGMGGAAGGGPKRVRVNEPKAGTPQGTAGSMAKAAAVAGAQLSITVPSASGTKRPGPSPKAGTPRKKSGTGSGGSTPKATAASSANSMYMKLPLVGDPKMSVWRAAHYLYYQKNDPAQEEGGTGGSTNSGGSNAAGNAFKYVVYEGEMVKSQREGRGVCLYTNQMLYEGEWKKNKEHGQGTLMTADRKKVIYKGEWERGRMHGKGTFYYSSGVVINSKQQVALSDEAKSKKKGSSTGGSGTEGVESYYEGYFKENLRHGPGKYVLPDGSSYDGQWREGMMCGRGTFNWADGSYYNGEWKEGRRHGTGFLCAADGFSYNGTWVQNTMEGRGTATYPNGQTYNGMFSQGRREGRGTIHFTNGAIYEGRFRDDAIDGQGTMKMSKLMTVPRDKKREGETTAEPSTEEQVNAAENAGTEGEAKMSTEEEEVKPDFMIPLSFQSDMGHIHQKAGFTVVGE